MEVGDIERLCKQRGWSRARLVLELRRVARARGEELPSDESLKRMIRQWINGERGLSERSAQLLTLAFGVTIEAASAQRDDYATSALGERIEQVTAQVDDELIELFAQQTQSFRLLDRRLGARRLLAQTESHVHQMTEMLSYARCGWRRERLAGAVAEAASLAGWQALDLGQSDKAWTLYETGKAAARESGDRAALAHVTAEQAYALIELRQVSAAVEQIRYAQHLGGAQIPAVLRVWLSAAEAEACAAAGDEAASRDALGRADQVIASAGDDQLAYVTLDETHLARWKGHCLARVGASEAVEDLGAALVRLDPTFKRARAGLLCDLALAYAARGETDAARAHARDAATLAEATTSRRLQRRIAQLAAGQPSVTLSD